MYELAVERTFCAAHALMLGGLRESPHGHNWHLTVVVQGDQLDADGLLCDFHMLESHVDRVIGGFNNADLNRTAPFDRINPTAEHVARHIATTVAAALPGGVRLSRVSVTEAPGCTATYRMDAKS